MTALVHKREIHGVSKAPYPACLFSTDFLQGTTTVIMAAVTCSWCRRLGGAA